MAIGISRLLSIGSCLWLLPIAIALSEDTTQASPPQHTILLYSFHGSAYEHRDTNSLCKDSSVDPTSDCWNILNVSVYLQDWWIENRDRCNSPPYQDDGFASCYQQIVGQGRLLQLACNDISLSCEKPPDFKAYTPVEYYVLQSIFGIWWWFNSIWYSAADGTLLANAKIGQIVNKINPVKPGDTSLGLILSALSAGFAFVNLPAGLEVSLATQAATQAATALQQAPGLGKALLPTGSLDSEFKQLTDIEDSLGDVLNQFQINVANTLKAAQDDWSLFLQLSQKGAFIAKQPSLNASTANITRTLNTFIVSQALQANNIIITVANNTNPYEVSRNLSSGGRIAQQNAWHVNCQENFTTIPGICSDWWYDGKDAYSLFNLGNRNENYYDLMIYMFEVEKWTAGEDLFHGARQCVIELEKSNFLLQDDMNFESNHKGVGWIGQLYIDPTTLEAQCSSNARICRWNSTNDLSLRNGRELTHTGLGNSDNWFWKTAGAPYPDRRPYRRVDVVKVSYPAFKFDACSIAYPWYCGWIAAAGKGYQIVGDGNIENITRVRDYTFTQIEDRTIPEKLRRQCGTPTQENIGWGGAGYIGFRGVMPCDEYPASYIGDALWTYEYFCPKPENGW